MLTTHAMEEADALCGRIGIMAYGALRCLGPCSTKRRFGDGFRVEVTHRDVADAAPLPRRDPPRQHPRARGGRERRRRVGGANTIVLQLRGSARLSEVFAKMEARPDDAAIVHWSLRQPSLEEVFLKLSRAAEMEQHGLVSGQPVAATASTQEIGCLPSARVAQAPRGPAQSGRQYDV